MNCPNCHQPVAPGAPFCGNCGQQLAAVPTVPATGVPQPMPAPPPQPGQLPPTPQPIYQQPMMAGAAPMGMPSYNSAPMAGAGDSHKNAMALAALIFGVLGLAGWIIPLVGVILGILALVFGTISIKSSKRAFAIAGICLAVPVLGVSIFFWVRNAQKILKAREKTSTVQTTRTNSSKSTSSDLATVTSPCYTTKVNGSLTIDQAEDSCTFQGIDAPNGEQVAVKVLNVPSLTAANLAKGAKADAEGTASSIPGGSITDEKESTFAGKPSYLVTVGATDGSAGLIDYVYDATVQGNLVIVLRTQRDGKNFDLDSIEQNWTWK